MNLFSDFKNVSTSFTPNNFQQRYPSMNLQNSCDSTAPNRPYEIIKNGQLVGYFWYQGNSIDLVFDISGTITLLNEASYLTVSDIINTLSFEANLYDFRGMKVLEYTNSILSDKQLVVDTSCGLDNATVTMQIDSETSAKLVKGVYKLELIASHPTGYRETLFSRDSAMFDVR